MQQLIETMTLNETVRRLRLLGVSTTETRVANAIQAGLYPWGICIPGRKHMCYEIYTKLFEKWVDERATEVMTESYHEGG